MSQTKIDVEIYADIICPWCYIGKQRLEAAFAARPQVTPRYIWRCFLLNPSMPEDGMDRQAYLLGKFGPAANAVYGRIAAAGLDSGISFNFDAIKRTPDSRRAHRFILAAAAAGVDLSEILFKAYFLDGVDIGNPDALASLAHAAGLDLPADTATDQRFDNQINTDLGMTRQLRIDGVPFMVFEGQYALAGAHLPDHIIPVIDAATTAKTDS
jgi:predicted DsbA family dithiol-disulfide isomerase